ncbi:MAG TPA: hypothetical protein VHV28_08245 [Solirubrobacteraceae bacterium]|nr:hypothetical protein [Solirubrobacteraceae bacterium]
MRLQEPLTIDRAAERTHDIRVGLQRLGEREIRVLVARQMHPL